MSAQDLLSRLEKVRKTGPDSWIACCPNHMDKNPSMTVKELDDGRVLLHCFAGCPVDSILGSVGLSFDALFPPKPIEYAKPLRRPFPAADVLEALSHEARIVAIAAADIAKGKGVDKERVLKAANRIEQGRRLANG